MIVLSLFDGMSCGQIAFERAGIPVEKYYASEIDKYAIKITQSNYPDTIQLGSITEWRSWNIEKPDIIIAGSPCQGFSFAGKQLNFNDPRSALFFTFVEILKHYKPKYFLLENVVMKKEYENVISNALGIRPVKINSALVSAQNRKRLYWSNIKIKKSLFGLPFTDIPQPEDKGILLKDIIENGITEKEKSYCIDANYHKGSSPENYIDKSRRQMIITGGRITGRNPENPKSRKSGLPTEQMLEIKEDGKANCLSTVGKDSLCIQIGKANISGHDYNKRIYSIDGESPTLTAIQGGNQEPKIAIRQSEKCENRRISNRKELNEKGNCLQASTYKGEAANGCTIINDSITWRKLTVTECERLQTVPDGYCKSVSNTHAYHALGNGWTVDIIAHIFSFIK